MVNDEFVFTTTANPAVLEEYARGQNDLEKAQRIPVANKIGEVMVTLRGAVTALYSGFQQLLTGMAILMRVNVESNQVLKAIRNTVLVSYMAFTLYGAYASVVSARSTIETAMAAAETTAAAASFQWVQIALAAASATVVAASFSVGYVTGRQKKERNESHVIEGDLNNPESQRSVMNRFSEVGAVG